MESKKIFIICSVRNATDEYKAKLENYTKELEGKGHKVHLPYRDTDQTKRGYEICEINSRAIRFADEVHVFYSADSQGTHFDLGVAFALYKKLVVVEAVKYKEGKSFANMIAEWDKKW